MVSSLVSFSQLKLVREGAYQYVSRMLIMTILLFIHLLVLSSISCAFNNNQILHVHNKVSSLQQQKLCAPIKMNGSDDDLRIRYLGAGEDAIVRPGVVLVAPKHEYDHFLMRSAVFVYAIGLNEDDDMIIRAVVLDNPTAFAIGEMSPQIMGSLSENILFRGGYDGQDSAMILHSKGGSNGPVKSNSEIGSSGIYEGGIVSAMESVDAGLISQDQCKFFFNYMQFTEKEIDNMFAGVEDGDAWVSCEIPTEYVLNSDYDRGSLWSKLRNGLREIRGNSA